MRGFGKDLAQIIRRVGIKGTQAGGPIGGGGGGGRLPGVYQVLLPEIRRSITG